MPDEANVQEGAGSDESQETSQADGQEGQDLEEKEPGGDSPEQIRARKEYRLRKKIEAEAQSEREKRIALEARVQTLQEVANRQPVQATTVVEQPKRFTSAEAWQKVDTGEWSREQASEYIADSVYLTRRNQERIEERATKEILGPVEEARKEALEYVNLFPTLANRTHPKWEEILKSVEFYRREDPRRTQIQAERLALREILGPIESVRANIQMERSRSSGDHHTETRSGGGFSMGKNNKGDKFSDIPVYLKDLWERSRTSDKDREIEAKYWRDNQRRRGSK